MPQGIDLSTLSDEDLNIYEDLLKQKQQPDYVFGKAGYALNPKNTAAKKNGQITFQDDKGVKRSVYVDPKLPAQLVPGVIAGHVRNQGSHGASGSWDAPAPERWDYRAGAAVQNFQKEHPVISAPLSFLEGSGKAAVDMVTGLPHLPGAVWHAATDPLTEEENNRHLGSTGGLNVLADRLVRPQLAAAKEEYDERGIPGVAGMAATFAVAPGLVKETLPEITSRAAKVPKIGTDMVSDLFKPKDPVVTTVRGLGIKDPAVGKWGPTALDEVGEWSDKNGAIRDTPTLRKALRDQMDANNAIAEPIIKQQHDVIVPGSRAEAARVRIEAIPAEIRLDEPARYKRLVDEANALADKPDYTIGELNELRKSLGAKNKTYGKDLSGQIAADHSVAAMDHAQESWARTKLYDSMDENSASGSAVKELKNRMSAMIKLDDAAFKKVNKSIVESGKRRAQSAIEAVGKVMTPGTTLKHFGENATIDSDVASAVRQWKRRPTKITAPDPKLPRPEEVPFRKQLGPGGGEFHIDPSAGPLYGQPTGPEQLRSMVMTPAEEGGGIPMRDVTPPKNKMLPAAPNTATIIQRSSGQVHAMPPKISGELPATAESAAAPKQLEAPRKLYQAQFVDPPSGKVYRMPPAAKKSLEDFVGRRRRIASGAGKGADVLLDKYRPAQVVLHQMAQHLMDEFAEASSGYEGSKLGYKPQNNTFDAAGNLIDEYHNNAQATSDHYFDTRDYKALEHSIKRGTIFEDFPEGPKEIAKAIRTKKGPLYGRIVKVAMDHALDYAKQEAPDIFSGASMEADTADWFN